MDQPLSTTEPAVGRTGPLTETVLATLRDALRGLRYGNVTIVVQDGRIVQIDRTDRRRLREE